MFSHWYHGSDLIVVKIETVPTSFVAWSSPTPRFTSHTCYLQQNRVSWEVPFLLRISNVRCSNVKDCAVNGDENGLVIFPQRLRWLNYYLREYFVYDGCRCNQLQMIHRGVNRGYICDAFSIDGLIIRDKKISSELQDAVWKDLAGAALHTRFHSFATIFLHLLNVTLPSMAPIASW